MFTDTSRSCASSWKLQDFCFGSLRSATNACLRVLLSSIDSRRDRYLAAWACHAIFKGYLPNSARTCRVLVWIWTSSKIFTKPICTLSRSATADLHPRTLQISHLQHKMGFTRVSNSGDLTIVRLPFIVLTPKGLGVSGCQLTQFPLCLLLPYATFSACQLYVCFQL